MKRGASFLENERLELVIFGGKGGVGKSTSAAASALYLAQARRQQRILVVSTDPAHSLGDSLDCPIGNKITPIEGFDNLWALELDADQLFADFKEEHGEAMREIAYRGTMFDRADIEEVFSLSIPGVDEAMAVIEIGKIHNTREYDLIIVDSAPSGHTVRLLALPEELNEWVDFFRLMQEKDQYVAKSLVGRVVRNSKADEFLETLQRDIARVMAFFRNIELTEFVPIVTPELMSIAETERLIAALDKQCISVRNMIVNRVMVEDGCAFCSSRKRDQEGPITEIEERFGSYNLIRVPLFPHQVRGREDLALFSDVLSGGATHYQRTYGVATLPQISPVATAKMSGLLEKDLKFILFGGKGGVGKTSMAAATALRVAAANPQKRVLLFSTDPFASLSDILGFPIGDKITPINGMGNLHALEIDAAKMFEEAKKEYREGIEEAFARPARDGPNMGGRVVFDKEIMIKFVESSPPGLDEAMALEKIVELVQDEAFDIYILDTAPSGHLIRFLELPQLARERLKVMIRLLLKYKVALRPERIGEKMTKQIRDMRKLREILIDPARTEFVCVTIPEAMAVLETEDLLSRVRELEIPCHHLMVNMIVPTTECSFCGTKRGEQQRYIQQVREMKSPEHLVVEVPLFPHQIKGMADLTNLAEIVYGKRN